jgi:NitT/TauT family transport system substrate-binding protein
VRLLPICLLLLAYCAPPPAARPGAGAQPAAATSAAPAASAAQPSPATAPAASPPQRTRVIAGYIPSGAAAPYFVGIERGYFEAEGVDLESENVAVTTEALAQAAAGNLHVANITIGVAALNVFASGIDLKIIGGTFGTPPTGPHSFPLLVRKSLYDSGEVRDASRLSGRKVAVNGTAVFSEYAVNEALKTGGLTVSDVDMQIMSFPDMPVALTNAAVDAAFPPEPFGTQALELGVAELLVTDYMHGVQGGAMVAGEAFVKDRPAIEAFLRAYLRALRDIDREGPTSAGVAAIMEKYTRVPAAVFQKTRPQYNDPEMRVNVASHMEQQEFYLERGYLRFTEPIDLNRWVDDGPRTAALRALAAR